MKYLMASLTIVSTFFFTGAALAQDMGKLVEAVDKDKAAESVDTEKMSEAMKIGLRSKQRVFLLSSMVSLSLDHRGKMERRVMHGQLSCA